MGSSCRVFGLVCALVVLVGCGEKDPTLPPAPLGPTFVFSTAPATAFGSPFPSDLLRDQDTGLLRTGLLSADARAQGFANSDTLAIMEKRMAERSGFGVNTAIYFPVDHGIDMATLEGRVHMVGLSGVDAGRVIELRTFWSEEAKAVGAFPLWSDYTVPGTRYLVWIDRGVTTDDGTVIDTPPELAAAIAGSSDATTNIIFEGAAGAMAAQNAGDPVMATVFTTEDPFAHLQAILKALDGYDLKPLEKTVSWDAGAKAFIEGGVLDKEALSNYFGTPEAPFDGTPGAWNQSARDAAEQLQEMTAPYTGGTFHQGIGAVVNGSFRVPAPNFAIEEGELKNAPQRSEDGSMSWSLESMVPFTLMLCESHLQSPSNIPVAVFSHGGTQTRHGMISYAVVNCLRGVATFSFDLPFHGGRAFPVGLPDQKLVAASGTDSVNLYSGQVPGDAGYAPDHIVDGAGPVESVGNLLGINDNFDPALVDANTLGYMRDTYMALRHLTENDWTGFVPGLSFDKSAMFHQSNSFGSSLTLGLSALTDRFKGVMWSAATAGLMSPSALSAPDFGPLANGIIKSTFGLKTVEDDLFAHSERDPMLSIWQWLIQRSDSSPWAPMVLRHRQGPGQVSVLLTNSSWDSTLTSTAQFMLTNALGAPSVRTEEWTLDATLADVPENWGEGYSGTPVQNNVTVDGTTVTAATFHWSQSGHVMTTRPVSSLAFEKVYPPLVSLSPVKAFKTPICAYQHTVDAFLSSMLTGGAGRLAPPAGSCEDLYGAPSAP